MPLQIIQRRDYLHNWATAEAASPPTGNLRRGEIAIAIVTDDGTDTGNIVEVIGRIGPSDTPTPFSDCPVVFRSPRGFKGADVRPVLVDEEPAVDSVLAFDSANQKFVSLSEDPGTYEEEEGGTEGGGTEGGGGETEGGGGELSEVAPTILSAQVKNLDSQAVVGTNPKYDLEVKVIGRPDPILSIEIIETAWPDYEGNAVNFTTTTAYNFTSDNLPAGVMLSVEDDPALAALGVRTYTFGRVVVNRDVPMSRVSLNAKIGASNPAGEAPAVERTLSGTIEFIEDPTTATPEPKLTKVGISEGGTEKSKIANLATDASVTLTANYVAADFTDGVANGTVSYQWSANGAALAGETGSTLTITNTADAYNDSQIKVDVTIADDNGTDTRSGYMVVGDYDEGFTEFSPAADSRLIYVAPDGDDAAAATAKGRGYYLPSDPEIGPDPTNPVGPITAYATHFEAAKRVRLSMASGEDANGFPLYANGNPVVGYPDWVLLKRGGSYLDDPSLLDTGNNTRVYNLGDLLGSSKSPTQGWDQARGRLWYFCGPWQGRSASEPAVVTAWGNESDPRPKVTSFTVCGWQRHTRITSLDVQGGFTWGRRGDSDDNTSGDILIEDVKATTFGGLTVNAGPLMTYDRGLVLRRCVAADTFNPYGHNQGFYFTGGMSAILTVEECVFDRNGYKEDPNEPTTWMGNIVGEGLAPGTGVQPRRTYYDRNLYLSTGAQFTLRGNIVSRNGGGGSVQVRCGGVVERNLFMWNESALHMASSESFGHAGSLIKDNLVLHDDHMIPPGGFGQGLNGGGWDDDVAVLDGNVLAHFHRHNNGGATIYVEGKQYSSKTPFEHVLPNAFILNNAIYREYSGIGIEIPPTTHTWGVASATVSNNQVSTPWGLSFQGDPSKPATYTYSGNRFHSPDQNSDEFRWGYHLNGNRSWRRGPYSEGTFADWQAAGFDTDGTFTTDFAAFKASVGWIEPERDIVSYMQAVDPTYVVNEDVYVDDGSTGQKQAVRQKVWEVMMRDVNRGRLPEDRAKEIARRYHAFITFIEKARNNRKGAWDSRWTADAVNNYIREGFGKTPVGGPYTASLDDLATYGASA